MKKIVFLFMLSLLLMGCPDQRNSITGPTNITDRENGNRPPIINNQASKEKRCYVNISGLRKSTPCSASGAITLQ